jgi:hypothetical protein
LKVRVALKVTGFTGFSGLAGFLPCEIEQAALFLQGDDEGTRRQAEVTFGQTL